MKSRMVFSVVLALAAAFFFLKTGANEIDFEIKPVKDKPGNSIMAKNIKPNKQRQNGETESNESDGTNGTNELTTKAIKERINYLSLSKRSVYECEEEINHLPDPDYWFYRYKTHDPAVSEEYQDNTGFGNGAYVRHSSPSKGHKAGYIVKDLISNREQLFMPAYTWMKWYILPKIRIDTNMFYYYDTTSVCRIDIFDFAENLVKSEIIKVHDFFNSNSEGYHGEYISQFNNIFLQKVMPFSLDSLAAINPEYKSFSDKNCRVDISVFWYGECEMWLDNIIVENEVAYDFFGDNPDKTRYHSYQKWLDWGIPLISRQGNILSIYEDGLEICNLPFLEKLDYELNRRSEKNIVLEPAISSLILYAHLKEYKNQFISLLQLKKLFSKKTDIKNLAFDKYSFNGL